jgi:hypothetical protein
MKTYGGVITTYIHVLLTSALVGDDLSASRHDCFILGENVPSTHWIGGWVDLRPCLDYMEN